MPSLYNSEITSPIIYTCSECVYTARCPFTKRVPENGSADSGRVALPKHPVFGFCGADSREQLE